MHSFERQDGRVRSSEESTQADRRLLCLRLAFSLPKVCSSLEKPQYRRYACGGGVPKVLGCAPSIVSTEDAARVLLGQRCLCYVFHFSLVRTHKLGLCLRMKCLSDCDVDLHGQTNDASAAAVSPPTETSAGRPTDVVSSSGDCINTAPSFHMSFHMVQITFITPVFS